MKLKPVVLALAVVGATPAAADENGPYPFTCASDMRERSFQHSIWPEIDRIAGQNSLARSVVFETVQNWDAQWMAAQCEAQAQGFGGDLGCLGDRRNWTEIMAMLPPNLTSMTNRQLGDVVHELTQDRVGYMGARLHCMRLGIDDPLRVR